jgi:hypothetical protein
VGEIEKWNFGAGFSSPRWALRRHWPGSSSSLPIWIFDAQTLAIASKEYRSRSLQRMAISQAAALLFVVGAVATPGFGLAGVYWLAPAIICSYFIALLDA